MSALLDAVRFMGRWETYWAPPTHVFGNKSEVVLEWRTDTEKAIAAFDGSGRYGVAFVTDDLVKAATHDGVVDGHTPVELPRWVVNNGAEIKRNKSWHIVEKEAP